MNKVSFARPGRRAGLFFLAGLAAASSHAAVDVASITAAGTDVATIGAAVFVVMVGVAVFKWIRKAL